MATDEPAMYGIGYYAGIRLDLGGGLMVPWSVSEAGH